MDLFSFSKASANEQSISELAAELKEIRSYYTQQNIVNGTGVPILIMDNITGNVLQLFVPADPPSMTFHVDSCVAWFPDGSSVNIEADDLTADAADTTHPRIDLIYINSSGDYACLTGTPSESPDMPPPPEGGLPVFWIDVAANATSVTAHE